MASTLIIGIGTTGLNIIEEAQQFHYEFTGKNKPDGNVVEYLFLETDIHKKPKKTPNGTTDIDFVSLSLVNNAAIISKLKNKNIDKEWIPDAATVLDNGDGAGGMPSYGRLALWGVGNYETVCQTIQKKYANINGDLTTKIIVVGTLTGGTGAGLCVDIAYLIRDLTGNENIEAYFLLPNRSKIGVDFKLFENSYSALTSLNFYSNRNNKYEVKWPNKVIKSIHPPYKFITLLSQDFSNAQFSITNLNELVRITGLIVTLNILDTNIPNANYFSGLIASKRVDNSVNKFQSCGIKMIQYPKSQLEEIVAIDISKGILKRWIDSKNYIDKNNNQSDLDNLKQILIDNTNNEIELFIDKAFKRTDGIKIKEGTIIKNFIDDNIKSILNKTTGETSINRFIFKLFSTQNSTNYFQTIKNNTNEIRDVFVESIHDLIVRNTKDYQNFHISKLVLDNIRTYFPELKNFWNSRYLLTGNDADWDNILKDYIDNFIKELPNYKWINQEKEYLNYHFNEILKLIKLHTIFPILDTIDDCILNGKLLQTNDKITLPTYSKIEQVISLISNTISNQDTSNNILSLELRETAIKADLTSATSCFFRIYQYSNIDEDVKKALEQYDKNTNRLTTYHITSNSELWNYFEKRDIDLYSNCISQSINFIKEKQIIGESNILQIINNLDKDDQYQARIRTLFRSEEVQIRNQIPALVKNRIGSDIFENDPSAKLIIAYKDMNELNNIFINYHLSDTASNSIDIKSLKNAIIIYQEYSYFGDETPRFNPLINIDYMDEVRTRMKRVVNEEFKMIKLPYLTIEQFNEYLKEIE